MFDADRGFGFIRPDEGDQDTFFHISTVQGGNTGIVKGTAVDFDLGVDPRNPSRTRATRVALAG